MIPLHLRVALWRSRALKAVTLLVLSLLLVACDMNRSSARSVYYQYLEHRNAAGRALGEGDCPTAEQEMKEAIEAATFIKELVPDEVDADITLSEGYMLLGRVYNAEHCARSAEATGFYMQALTIREEALGPSDPLVANVLTGLGWNHYRMGRYEQAEPVLVRALEIYEGSDDARLEAAIPLLNLGELYRTLGRYADAEGMFKRSLDAIQKSHLSGKASGRKVAVHLESYAGLLRQTGRIDEAEELESRARILESEDG